MKKIPITAICIALLPGCMTSDSFADQYAASACDLAWRCFPEQAADLTETTSAAACAETMAAQVSTDIGDCEGFDADAANECLDLSKALECEVLFEDDGTGAARDAACAKVCPNL